MVEVSVILIAIANILLVKRIKLIEKELEENDLIINLMLKKLNGVEDGRD